MRISLLRTVAAAALLAVFSSVRLGATLLYWDSDGVTAGAGATPTGTWGTDSFWNSDATGAGGGSFTAATTSADSLYFSAGPNTGTGAYAVTVSGTRAALGITFQNKGAITVSGGTLEVGSGGITTVRTVTTTNDRAAVTISSNISLQASQTWTADTTLSGAFFLVSGNVTGTGNLTLTQNGNRAFTISGNLNHTGTLTSAGFNAAGMTVSGNIGSNVTDVRATSAAVLTLSGTNTYSGNTLIGASNVAAVVRAGSNSALSSATTVILSAGGTTGTASLDLGNGANSYSVTAAGLSTSGTRLAFNTVTNGSTGTGTATLTINSDGATAPADSVFGGIIQDGATAKVALTKAGGQTLTLNGTNTYTGATRVTGGTLALGAAGSISANSALTVDAGATFDAQALVSYAFSTAATTTLGVGATSAGQIKAAEAVFSSANLAFDFGSASTLLSSYTVLVSTTETGHFAGVTATGTSISGAFVDAGSGNWTLTAGGYSITFSESAGTLTSVVSAVPEPSMYALLAGAAGLVLALGARRRK
ncbi:MAG: beta strand repeat-containing protein [Rariglobus sp.]|nr:autotransporter-associated beta strand repeat-containing protein [Rariglobus sp.]